MTPEKRAAAYYAQNGVERFTPAQRRRQRKKANAYYGKASAVAGGDDE